MMQGLPKFLWVPPIILGTGKATNFNFGRDIHGVYPNKSPLNILEKRERGRMQALPKLFWVPPIISGIGKATAFKFGQYIRRVHPNKSPLNTCILEKRKRGRIQGLPKFLGYPLLSHKRVKLRTSNFMCTFMGPIGRKAH